jgi:hypothetical protein
MLLFYSIAGCITCVCSIVTDAPSVKDTAELAVIADIQNCPRDDLVTASGILLSFGPDTTFTAQSGAVMTYRLFSVVDGSGTVDGRLWGKKMRMLDGMVAGFPVTIKNFKIAAYRKY